MKTINGIENPCIGCKWFKEENPENFWGFRCTMPFKNLKTPTLDGMNGLMRSKQVKHFYCYNDKND